MRLTKEEFKAAHNNIMTVMENHIMMLAHCDRTTANIIANEVKTLLEQEKIGAGGYYSCVKFHNENGVKVIDKCKLQYVSMTLEPADEYCSFEIVRENKEND